jgi:hypothetical protein
MRNTHFAKYLPPHWVGWLEKRNGLSATDFHNGVVKLIFEDDSFAVFDYAFCVEDKDRAELAVFTEHCGYHVFSTRGLEWCYMEHARLPFEFLEENQ